MESIKSYIYGLNYRNNDKNICLLASKYSKYAVKYYS